MKYLGIDYGKKRIGLAYSDDEGKIAFPLQTLPNNKEIFSVIAKLAEGKGALGIVVGESRNASGEDNPLMGEVKKFAVLLREHFSGEIFFEDESISSMNSAIEEMRVAEKRRGKGLFTANPSRDQEAAALILQRFLDKSQTK